MMALWHKTNLSYALLQVLGKSSECICPTFTLLSTLLSTVSYYVAFSPEFLQYIHQISPGILLVFSLVFILYEGALRKAFETG